MDPRSPSSAVLFALSLILLAPLAAHAQSAEPALLDTWGTVGTGPGEWVQPLRMTATARWTFPDEDILVVDRPSGRVQRFTIDGTPITEWRILTTPMLDPVAVAWMPERGFPSISEEVLVLDAVVDAVLFFDIDGNYLRQFPVTPFEDGDLDVHLADERIYVVLTDRHVVEIYTFAGILEHRVGALDLPGSGIGQFDSPRNVAVLWEADTFAVSDTGNDRVQVYLFSPFDSPEILGSSGSGSEQLSTPLGLAFDCRGDLLVADTGNDRVQKWTWPFGGSSYDTSWFAPPGGGLSHAVDLIYPLVQGVIIGKEGDTEKRRAISGDLFVLDAGAGQVRQYEDTCCGGGFFDCQECTATTAGGDLMITPAGTGPTLDSVGATVEVFILDQCGDSVAGYPFQDLWLDDIGNGEISLCQGGSVADANTDVNGRTTIGGAIFGGGWTEQGLSVYVSGLPLSQPPLAIRVVSPDFNADLKVDLVDIGEFALDYFAPQPTFRSDLNFDGSVNLADIGRFALHLGEECP